ncbi:ABC transporter ATP-binding protein [bacterium]|nr:ABC transporter ATP-binding protein [bacterium]
MPSFLRVTSLDAFYGPLHALKAVSLHVNQGEIVALLGANGAGKSTTLNTVCGLLTPRSGTVEYDGCNITGARPERIVSLGLTQVPEGRQIFGDLSVRDNLLLGGYVRWRSGRRQEVVADLDRMVEIFPILEERMYQRAGTLSGGQQQMLAIARALMSSPRLLLLDEPSMGLAPLVVRDILATAAHLRAENGTTILLVEQNAAAALKIADRGYVLETGRIVLEGSANQLLRDREVQRAYLGKDYEEV